MKRFRHKRHLRVLKFPEMKCDEGCGQCCGPVPVTASELAKIKAYMTEHGVQPRPTNGVDCVFYQGTCTIYPVRPFMCRAFGHSKKLECPKGYNTNISDERIQRAIRERIRSEGPDVGILGEVV